MHFHLQGFFVCGHMFLFMLDKYPKVELVGPIKSTGFIL